MRGGSELRLPDRRMSVSTFDGDVSNLQVAPPVVVYGQVPDRAIELLAGRPRCQCGHVASRSGAYDCPPSPFLSLPTPASPYLGEEKDEEEEEECER